MCAFSFPPNIVNEDILDNLEQTNVDIDKFSGLSDDKLNPVEFEYMFTIRLQSRGKARMNYEGYWQRLESILDAYTFGWNISIINDDDPYLAEAPCEPNLLMGDSSKSTLCIQIDMNKQALKPELIVLLFDVFWKLRASMLQWLRFWVSSCSSYVVSEDGNPKWLLCHMNNDNSFRSCASKYAYEILHDSSLIKEIDVLSGFLFEIIAWSGKETQNQDSIKKHIKKMQFRAHLARVKNS